MRSFARLISAALVTAAAVSTTTPTAAHAVGIVYDIDFEDGTTGSWEQSGGPTLEIVDVDGDGDANRALQVADRTIDSDGIKSPTDLLAGVEYTFSMEAKLATTGTADIRFVSDPGFTWVGNTTINGDTWTTVTGTFTPAEATAVYIGTSDHSVDGSDYTYYVDDLQVTSADTERGTVELFADGFEDDIDGWFPFGGPTLSQSDASANTGTFSLLASGRTAGFEGPATDLTSALTPDTDYDVSAWVSMPEAGTVGMTVKRTDSTGAENFENVASVVVEADTWTELTGTYSYADATELIAYFESATITDIAIDDVSITTADTGGSGPVGVVLTTTFDDGLGGWVARDAGGAPSVATTTDAYAGAGAAQVSDRASQGDGIGYDVTDVMPAGANYEITAWVKMAEGSGSGDISLTMRRTTDGVEAYDTIFTAAGVAAGSWTQIVAPYRMPARGDALMYFETAFPDGTIHSFLVDEVVVEAVVPPVVEDLLPIKDTLEPKMGVAVDSRETTGPAGELVERHFDQMTPENHMKPNAWYDDVRNFAIHPDAEAIMDFAQANDIDVYGHTLLWHQQNPEWFFTGDDGQALTTSPADQEFLRNRMRGHIFAVAETLSDRYGLFGSDTNPLTAFDVVNETISDGVGGENGLRQSAWYDLLGESYIDLAFQYADEAFNTTYAAPGADRPVLLAINDYNTEQSAKRGVYRSLVERMIARDVPFDIVGHQFHVNLAVPISALGEAIDAFSDLPVTQVVSELDVPTGVPVSEALLIDQGYYYRDAFRLFRERADELYSVSVWGLTDNRSWLADRGDPLIFDGDFQAKQAYYGIVDGELPPPQRSAFVFESDVELTVESPQWQRLPLLAIDDDTAFQLRWNADGLVAYVETVDPSVDAGDAISFTVGESTYAVKRDGSGDIAAEAIEIVETDDGWRAVVALPLTGPAQDDLVAFDVSVTDGDASDSWNVAGTLGSLTLIEPLSYIEAIGATTAPTIDAAIDDVWADANSVTTDTAVQSGGDADATATFRTLWADDTLYVLAEVTDSTPDVSASDPFQQDSIEVFLDPGNTKNGAYLADDAQIRISAENVLSFGAGSADPERIESATTYTDTGYVVEASITLFGEGGENTFHGVDFQVNDGNDGTRTAVRTWAEPTGTAYQTTARWGVVQLVAVAEPPGPTCDQTIEGNRRTGVVVGEGLTCIAPEASVRGSVLVLPGGSLSVDGAEVRGRIIALGADAIEVSNSSIRGSIALVRTVGPVRFADNDLRGGLTVQGTSGSVDVSNNEVRGSVLVISNGTGGDSTNTISANSIRGSLSCFWNEPEPTDGGVVNEVRGRASGQCGDLVSNTRSG